MASIHMNFPFHLYFPFQNREYPFPFQMAWNLFFAKIKALNITFQVFLLSGCRIRSMIPWRESINARNSIGGGLIIPARLILVGFGDIVTGCHVVRSREWAERVGRVFWCSVIKFETFGSSLFGKKIGSKGRFWNNGFLVAGESFVSVLEEFSTSFLCFFLEKNVPGRGLLQIFIS